MLLLWEREKTRQAREQSLAAFSGFCAGKAFAQAWTGELGDFSEFYKPGGQEPPPPKPTTQDHIQMMRDRGEGGPPC